MFTSDVLLNVLRKMTYITVAMTEAPAVNKSAAKVRMVIGSCRRKIRFALCSHRGFLEKPIGTKMMHRNVRMVPTRKHANIHQLATRTMCNTSVISVGKAIEAPANNSLRMISTGLNQ